MRMRGGPLMFEHSQRDHVVQAQTIKASQSQTSQALKNLRAYAIVMVVSFHSVLAYLASQPAAPESSTVLPIIGWRRQSSTNSGGLHSTFTRRFNMSR